MIHEDESKLQMMPSSLLEQHEDLGLCDWCASLCLHPNLLQRQKDERVGGLNLIKNLHELHVDTHHFFQFELQLPNCVQDHAWAVLRRELPN